MNLLIKYGISDKSNDFIRNCVFLQNYRQRGHHYQGAFIHLQNLQQRFDVNGLLGYYYLLQEVDFQLYS
jgi:hypothetical protein